MLVFWLMLAVLQTKFWRLQLLFVDQETRNFDFLYIQHYFCISKKKTITRIITNKVKKQKVN
jgi:hypothetical protein